MEYMFQTVIIWLYLRIGTFFQNQIAQKWLKCIKEKWLGPVLSFSGKTVFLKDYSAEIIVTYSSTTLEYWGIGSVTQMDTKKS